MKKILVIEDAHALRKDILEMLRFEGFETEEAENGAVGVKVAREYQPDLIICDIMMPELNGYQVLDILRGDQQTATIPFIFLTAKTDRNDVRRGMASGADDYLTKPFKTLELLSAIHARLKRKEDEERRADEKLAALRQQIITSLPHELRTPLNTIIGFSDLLITDSWTVNPEMVVDWSRHINEAAQRLYRLVENYVAYARVETMVRSHEYAVNPQSCADMPRLWLEVQIMQIAHAYQRDADLYLGISDVPHLRINEDDLRKIVSELVDNAFKFSTRGQAVSVNSSLENGLYTLSIEDRGRGMKPDQLASIGAYMQFERWLYEQQGIGLGLTIARRLVEVYQGQFEMHSAYGEGTVVRVALPVS